MPMDGADPAGRTVAGRYQLARTLGSGAFGHTFLARDREADCAVALKRLDPLSAPSPAVRRRHSETAADAIVHGYGCH